MPHLAKRFVGVTLLSTLSVACSETAASATATDPATRAITTAREALSNWSAMKAETFRTATEHALVVTERRVEDIRQEIANSEAATDSQAVLADLKLRRNGIEQQLSGVKDAAKEELEAARKAIVDGVSEFHDRVNDAWAALTRD